MNTKETIRDFIVSELVTDRHHSELSDTDKLIETGIIDSLGIMKLIGFLEEELSFQMEDHELIPENFSSIESIAQLIEKKRIN